MKIKNGLTYEKDGWKYVSISGKPKERGYAHGYLCAKEFKEVQRILGYLMMEEYGQDWSFFIEKINEDFKDMTKKDFPEIYEEMEGIANGCNAAGCKTNLDEILAWNFYYSLPYWYPLISDTKPGGKEGGGIERKVVESGSGAKDKCSAFIAVGDWTKDGKIVVAHNSFVSFIDGQFSNIVLDVNPDKGHRFIMQTSPCWIWSGSDFFVTDAGFIGTETTIGGFLPYEKKFPVGYRIRKAMQYGETLDQYADILLEGNSGDYANSWLFGDINNNEIMRIELGLKFHNIERTKNGFFIGFNAPYDPRIRNIEVNNSGFYDVRRHQGARKVRLGDLMDKYKGKIDINVAKDIISDHYDVYLLKENNPCSRTVCSHYELDGREYMSQADRPKPYQPQGAVDGIVCDTNMAKKVGFYGRFGSSCGKAFNSKEFFNKHKQWKNFEKYVKDRPSEPWAEFTISKANTIHNGKKNKQKASTNKKITFKGNNKTKKNNLKAYSLKLGKKIRNQNKTK